jgi:HAD superfamily phosphoserine phosphatase-like hydrolase
VDKTSNKWAKAYGRILKEIFTLYAINETEFFIKGMGSDSSSLRQWTRGRNFPSKTNHEIICNKLEEILPQLSNSPLDDTIKISLENVYHSLDLHNNFFSQNNAIEEYLVTHLKICYSKGKQQVKQINSNNKEQKQVKGPNAIQDFPATGKIQAVVFDFDGTLTIGNAARTTWESIWIELGYDVQECVDLHKQFDKKQINHTTWCKLTEEKFKEKKMTKDILNSIVKRIKLINGCSETFIELSRRNIKIYIVSGSILFIIQRVLKNLYQYVDDVKANDLKFSANGLLTEIIGTKYDFAGKAQYIKEIATKIKISTKDILFIGNSYNDKYAYRSGAYTLCINPKVTDTSNFKVWNNCIKICDNLFQIFDYINI